MSRLLPLLLSCLFANLLCAEQFDDKLHDAITAGDADAIESMYYHTDDTPMSSAIHSRSSAIISELHDKAFSIISLPSWICPVVPDLSQDGLVYPRIRPTGTCYISQKYDKKEKGVERTGLLLPVATINNETYLIDAVTKPFHFTSGDVSDFVIQVKGTRIDNIVMDAVAIYSISKTIKNWACISPSGYRAMKATSIDMIVFPPHPDGQSITLTITKNGHPYYTATHDVTDGFVWKK